MTLHITLSDNARIIAEKRAREEGFESVDAYLNALIEEDRESALALGWMRERILEGLASPSAGEIGRDEIGRLIGEGIARAASKG